MSVPGRSDIQGLWVGGNGLAANANESTPFQPGQLGKVTAVANPGSGVGDTPQVIQYVRRYTTDSATAAAGSIAFWVDLDEYTVSAEGTDAIGGASLPLVAGLFLGANPTTENYGFIVVGGGPAEAVVTGTIPAGTKLVCDAQVFRAVAATNDDADLRAQAVMVDAVTTAIGTANTVLLDVIRNGW
jgi:hypothetical protein